MSESGFRISELGALVITLGDDSIGYEDGARIVIHRDGTGHIEGKTYQTIANGQRRAKHFTLNLTRVDTDALRAAYTQVISRGDDYHGCQRCGRNPVVVHGRRYCSSVCANNAGEYSAAPMPTSEDSDALQGGA